MAYKVIETGSAHQDLAELLSYLSATLANPSAAAAFADAVEGCYSRLEKAPFSCELCRDPWLCALGYRKAVIRNYIMIYRVDKGRQTVYGAVDKQSPAENKSDFFGR